MRRCLLPSRQVPSRFSSSARSPADKLGSVAFVKSWSRSFFAAPIQLTAAVMLLGSYWPAAAQTAGSSASTTQTTTQAPAVAGDDDRGKTDAIDLIKKWRKKPTSQTQTELHGTAVTIVPVFGAKPNTGWKFGIGADVEFHLGEGAETRFSTLTSGVTISTRKQLSLSENLQVYGAAGRWIVIGQNLFNQSTSDNVDLGTSADLGSAPLIDYRSLRFFDTYYRRLRGQLYAGVGLFFDRQSNVEPNPEDSPGWDASPFRTYSAQHGFDPSSQTSVGPAAAVLFDNRDNPNDAILGWYGLARYRWNVSDFLGGDSTWEQFYGEVRTYRAITSNKRHKLAFWGIGTSVTSGVAPYLALSTSGGDASGHSSRGYAEGRFRGEKLLYAEVEYRGLMTRNGFLGLALFTNMTTVSNTQTGERLFDSTAVGAGVGLRVLFHKRSRSNFCVDVGFGRDGSHGLYIGLRDAF